MNPQLGIYDAIKHVAGQTVSRALSVTVTNWRA